MLLLLLTAYSDMLIATCSPIQPIYHTSTIGLSMLINKRKNQSRVNQVVLAFKKERIRKNVALYLACGVDPDKNIIYLQSENLYHANLSWVLECNTYMGEASRMTQYKDKSSKGENVTVGLFTYPILMASDILLYDADYVPVGIDQKQHVELARNIAERFNKTYGNVR